MYQNVTWLLQVAFAFWWLSMISSNSASASDSSLTVLRAFKASSIRSCCTSQRGDFGIKGMQINKINAGPICIAIAQRQPSSKWTSLWSIKDASRMPAVIISWYTDVRHPRKLGGANSLWYKETTALRRPIESPEIKRPTSIIGMDEAKTCRTLPTRNVADPMMMELRLPQTLMQWALTGGKEEMMHPIEKIPTMKPGGKSGLIKAMIFLLVYDLLCLSSPCKKCLALSIQVESWFSCLKCNHLFWHVDCASRKGEPHHV